MRNYESINNKIKNRKAVILTAEEATEMVNKLGLEKASKHVDVVTTGTFAPMCSSGAFINISSDMLDIPIKFKKVLLNGVPAYAGLASLDMYIGATQLSEITNKYGGAHVIYDLISGKNIRLQADGYVTQCKPRKQLDVFINKENIGVSFMFNPRNAYQNYNAITNTSGSGINTYMGYLKPNLQNICYAGSGQLSPLINDPYYKTIGIGTPVFIGGTRGYITWKGTQFNMETGRNNCGIPLSPAATLAIVADLKKINRDFIKPVIIPKYGISLLIGIGIAIPILNKEIMKHVSISNSDISVNVVDYGSSRIPRTVIKAVSYEELSKGHVMINGKRVTTHSISNIKKSRMIALSLKDQIISGSFAITKPAVGFSEI